MMDSTQFTPVYLFLHIPKTAGSTLTDIILSNYTPFDSKDHEEPSSERESHRLGFYHEGFTLDKIPSQPNQELLDSMQSKEIAAIQGHFAYGLHEYIGKASKYITFLRDPIKRIVSLYRHELLWFDDSHEVISKNYSIGDLLSIKKAKDLDNALIRWTSGVDFDFGQCTSDILQRAKTNLEKMFAFVGITEYFDESLVLLADLLNWKTINYIPRLVSNFPAMAEYSTADEIQKLRELNRFDIEFYGFARSQFENTLRSSDSEVIEAVARFRSSNENWSSEHRFIPIAINSAGAKDLATLPSIGPVLASRIVNYRDKHGPFNDPRQLLNVSGLGRFQYRYILSLITL